MFCAAVAWQDGTLGVDEVYSSILRKADPKISAAEAKQIFDSCDHDGDGKIKLEELRDYLHPVTANESMAYRNSGAHEAFAWECEGGLRASLVSPT